MSKWVGGFVALVALGSLTSVRAFKTAAVTNSMPITVSATDSAALAMLAPAAGTLDNGIALTQVSTGQLIMTVNEAMQPGSTYCFSSAFKIKNSTTYTVTFDPPTIVVPSGVTVTMYQTGGTACSTTFPASLTAGSNTDVDLKFVLTSGATVGSAPSSTITINAHR